MLYNQTKGIAKHYKCTMVRQQLAPNSYVDAAGQYGLFLKHNADLAEVQPLQRAPAPN